VVPVKEEVIDAMIRSGIDLLFHHLRFGLILVSPEWDFRLLVMGKTGRSVTDKLPLRPTRPVDLLVSWIDVVVRKIVTTHPNTGFINH
jgi:hypothetical protein